MNPSLIARLEKLYGWKLLIGIALLIICVTELIVAMMSLLLHGIISDDLIFTGLVTSVIVALLGVTSVNYLLQELMRRSNLQTALSAARDKDNLELAIRTAQILIWELDTTSGQFRYDENQFGLLGLQSAPPPHDVQQWISLVHPEDRAIFIERFQAALQPESPLFDLEYRFSLTPDSQQQSGSWHQNDAWSYSGSWVWLHSKGSVIRRDDSGKPLLAVGTTINVTVRKIAELQMRDAKRRFELIFNSSPDVMVISRLPEGIITNVNDAFVTSTGYSKQEALGNTTVGLGFWSEAERNRMADVIARDGYCRALEFEFTLKNGEKRTGSFSSMASRLEGSQHLISTVHDITDRKQMENALKASETRFRSIIDAMPVPLAINDADGNITYLNRAFQETLGYTLEDISTLDAWWPLAYPDPQYRQSISENWQRASEQAITNNLPFTSIEAEVRCKDGLSRTFIIRGTLIAGEQDGLRLVSLFNITEQKQSQNALARSKKLLQTVLDTVPVRVFWKDRESRYLGCNPAFARDAGLDHPSELIGKDDSQMGWKDQAELYRADDRQVMESGLAKLSFDEPQTTPDGHMIWLRTSKTPLRDQTGEVIGIVGMYEDITSRKLANLQLAERKEQLRTLVEAVPDSIQFKDGIGRWLIANTVCLRLFGLEGEEWRNLTDSEIAEMHPRLATMMDSCRASDEEAWRSGKLYRNEEKIRDADGDLRYYDVLKVPLFSESGERKAIVIVSRDITEKKQTEELIWNQANFDPLTLLPNRRMFRDRLTQDIKKAHRAGLKLALLFLDLDHFKEVNDTLGHDAGDTLLIDAAYRISACVRDSDTVARLGGDEFTIILAELEDASAVERIARDIIHSLSQPFHLENDTVYVSASVGITLYPDDGTDLETLIKNADQAMFAAKEAGRNRYSYFTRSLQDEAQHRQQVISDLRVALPNNQFRLYYQPIVELATGQVRKAECLLRWLHPKRGIVTPEDFIPLAEDSGLIHEIGAWIFKEVALQLNHCRENCDAGFQLSVNVSPVQFHDSLQQHKWLELLATNHLKGSSIVIEITEGLLLDTSDHVTEQLLAFRDAGVQVAIDDFGTGYSALSYLNRLDIDYLKIDQSFTRNLAPNSSDMALVEAIIVMAHKLGLKVIAEGVETAEQNALLRAVNCDYVQGYYYSMPLPAEDLQAWLKQRRAAAL